MYFFVVYINHDNIPTTKISRSMVLLAYKYFQYYSNVPEILDIHNIVDEKCSNSDTHYGLSCDLFSYGNVSIDNTYGLAVQYKY